MVRDAAETRRWSTSFSSSSLAGCYPILLLLFLSISLSPSLSRSGLRALDLPTSGTHPVPCHYVVISDNERVSANSLLYAYLRSKAATGREASFAGNLAANITSELLAAPTDLDASPAIVHFKIAWNQTVIQINTSVLIKISIHNIYIIYNNIYNLSH